MANNNLDPSIGANTQFGKGQDPTKGGRPKKFKSLFNECINDDERRIMIEAQKEKAMKGDIQAFREIMDRTDGKATQEIALVGAPVMLMNDARQNDEEE